MIDPKCFTTEWIEEKSKTFKYPDKNLIEKVIRALSLLDMLARSGCPFHFKGGSYLATLIQYGINKIEHYDGDLSAVADMAVSTLTNKLNKIKLANPEAFYYWCKTDSILSSVS